MQDKTHKFVLPTGRWGETTPNIPLILHGMQHWDDSNRKIQNIPLSIQNHWFSATKKEICPHAGIDDLAIVLGGEKST